MRPREDLKSKESNQMPQLTLHELFDVTVEFNVTSSLSASPDLLINETSVNR